MRIRELIHEAVKTLDPDLFDEIDPRFIVRIAKKIVPNAVVRADYDDGVTEISTEDGLHMYIGASVAEGGYDIYVSGGGGAVAGGEIRGRVTTVIGAVASALPKKFGVSQTPTTLTIDDDHGFGVWQHIAQKLGLKYEAGAVVENFKDGKKK